jgi:regulator of protease activity HflC (stomatin/prohibitin superfamily)
MAMVNNIQFPDLPENLGGHFGRLVLLGAGGLLGLIIIFSSYYTIDQGARGVILRNGAILDTADPGLHFKLPLIDKVATISVQQQTQRYPKVQAYSRDQQPADLVISVTFRVTDPEQVYSQYGDIDNLLVRLIDPRVLEQVKNVFGQFDAASAIQDRSKLNAEVSNAVRAAIRGPMVIESLQIENIDFSDIYEQAVEDRMQATVLQQKALAQKARRLTEADAAAYEVKAAADAQAHAIEIKGAAEASAIKARGDALRQNPGIPALVTAEKWDGHLPTTMPPNGAVPFLNVQH